MALAGAGVAAWRGIGRDHGRGVGGGRGSRIGRRLVVLLAAVALAGCDGLSIDTGDNGDNGEGGNLGSSGAGQPTVDPFADYTFPPLDITPRPVRTLGPDETPGPTPPDLTPYLTANLTLTNASEDNVDVVVAIVDTDTGTRTDVIAIALGPSGLKAQKLPDATYYATFTRRASGAQSACAFHVFKGDQVGFTALAEHILITSTSFSPSTGADLDITTSFACQARLS